MIAARKIRVLVIDDSAVDRRLFREVLSADPEIEVVGTATDPYAARDQIVRDAPDVITLDLEMPRMDGLTFLKIIMEQRPMPVVVLSSLTRHGSQYALEALRLGAVEVLGKADGSQSVGELGPRLTATVKAAAVARIRPATGRVAVAGVKPPAAPARVAAWNPRALILLGASTGGTEAIREVFSQLPPSLPPVAVVQHIPAAFSRAFAERLDQISPLRVVQASNGDVLEPGCAYVAPGDFHLVIQWLGGRHVARVVTGPQVWHQRPAVDVLFKSVAELGTVPHVMAGILTGMGKDGAEGLLRLRERGAVTFAQDEASCVVYGMPRVAWECGAVERQLPLEQVPAFIRSRAERLNLPRPAVGRSAS